MHRLFVLTSVEILEEIQALNYLTKSEIYSKDELDRMKSESSLLTEELINELFKD